MGFVFVCYLTLVLSGGSTLLSLRSLEETAKGPFAPYVRFLDACVGLFAGWGTVESMRVLVNVVGVEVNIASEEVKLLISALIFTAWGPLLNRRAAVVLVRRRVFGTFAVTSQYAAKLAHFYRTASVLAVGWAWEELVEKLLCMGKLSASARHDLMWTVTLALFLLLLPTSAYLGSAAERVGEAAEEALLDIHGEGPAESAENNHVPDGATTPLAPNGYAINTQQEGVFQR